MSLRQKIILSVVLIILFFGSLAIGAVFFYAKSSLVEKRKEDLRSLINAQSLEINQLFKNSVELTETITEQELIRDYFRSDRRVQDEKVLHGLNQYNINGKYLALYLLDSYGNALVSTDPSFVGENYSFRNYFKESAAGRSAVGFALGVTSKQPGYYFAHPIQEEEGRVVGIVVAKMDPGVINKALASVYSAGGKVMFTDDLGVVIYSNRSERIYKALGPLDHEESRLLEGERRYDGFEVSSLQYSPIQKSLSGSREVVIAEIFDEEEKEAELFAVKKIEDFPFFLVIEESYDEYVGSALTAAFLLGFIVLLAALGAGIILLILVSRFLKPLDLIEAAALKIGQGDFGVRIDESRLSSELKRLASAFNLMVASVIRSREEVDKKVELQVAEIKEKSQEIEDQQKATINILEDVNNSQEELKLRYKELDVIKSLTQKLGTTLEEATVMKNIAAALQELFPEASVSFVITPILTGEKLPNTIYVHSLGRLGRLYLEEVRRQVVAGFEKFPLYLKKQAYWQKWTKKDFSMEMDEGIRSETESKLSLSHLNVSIAVPNTLAGLINISSGLPNFFDEQKNIDVVNAIVENAIQTIERLKILITLEHSRLQDLVESMRNGVVMFGADRRIVVANSSAKNVLAIEDGDYSLESILRFMQGGKTEGAKKIDLIKLYDSAVQKSKPQRVESLEIGRRFYEVVITPVNDLQKEVSGGAIIFHDITHLKEIDRMKTEFVSVASHQLRTPLTAINWYVEMLQSGDAGALNDDQKSFLSEIYKGSVRMVKLVNELLNVSRLETGRLRVSPKPTYLDELIKDIIHELEAMADKYGCKMVFQEPEKRLPKIGLDETLMRQVIHNFITNAIRYSPGGGSEVTVTLAEKEGDYLVGVTDRGIGIPQEAQGKIFQKFFRADNARKKEGEGSGIGLYIAKMIMEASMGKIWFESPSVQGKTGRGKKAGGGTTFYAAIPKKGMLAHEGERELAI